MNEIDFNLDHLNCPILKLVVSFKNSQIHKCSILYEELEVFENLFKILIGQNQDKQIMDWNNILFKLGLNLRSYDVQSNNLITKKSKPYVKKIIRSISLICAIKMLIIALSSKDLKPYLIELQLFLNYENKIYFIGLGMVEFGFYLSYSFWMRLNENDELFERLNFLFISEFKKLFKYYDQHYDLNRSSTILILKRSKFYRSLILPLSSSFSSFTFLFVSRCFYGSFNDVNVIYFFTFGLVLTIITLFNYFIYITYIIIQISLLFLSVDFMIIRLNAIEQMILDHFKIKRIDSISNFTNNEESTDFKKQSSKILKIPEILKTLNSFLIQFKSINYIFDTTISKIMLGSHIAMMSLPYYLIFSNNSIQVKLYLTLATVSWVLFTFSISFYNDKLKNKVNYDCFIQKID